MLNIFNRNTLWGALFARATHSLKNTFVAIDETRRYVERDRADAMKPKSIANWISLMGKRARAPKRTQRQLCVYISTQRIYTGDDIGYGRRVSTQAACLIHLAENFVCWSLIKLVGHFSPAPTDSCVVHTMHAASDPFSWCWRDKFSHAGKSMEQSQEMRDKVKNTEN